MTYERPFPISGDVKHITYKEVNMGLYAMTKAGDIQYTTLMSIAAKFAVVEGFEVSYGFTRSEVEDIVRVLELMREYKSCRTNGWTPLREDASINDGTRGWYFRKLKVVGVTIDKLKAWLLLNEDLLSFA